MVDTVEVRGEEVSYLLQGLSVAVHAVGEFGGS